MVPLPHQLYALNRAMSQHRIRYLLADEVGLGKTIEAGLILRELKLRGMVRRILVVAPKGLVRQWQAEMRLHFGEKLQLIDPAELAAFRQWRNDEENLWRLHDQVICSLDSVKPIEGRRGWSLEQLNNYNRERFEDLVSASWDLVIIDEAHRMGGSTDQVARYKLGAALAEAAPYLLLLSATPHQGKTDQFLRLMQLRRPGLVPRRRQRHAGPGAALCHPHREARRDRRGGPAALQAARDPAARGRLAGPPWRAAAPVRGRHRLRAPRLQPGDRGQAAPHRVPDDPDAAAGDLEHGGDPHDAGEAAGTARLPRSRRPTCSMPPRWTNGPSWTGRARWISLSRRPGWAQEKAEVDLLLNLARETEAQGTDAKAEALLELIYKLQQEENDPALKVLVFTEFVPTQAMLADFLESRGFSVALLNGSMDLDARTKAQQAFARDVRVLISTDAGGEGLNLQFCHVIVNFDMPWNPMRLEQRIGRVDRIGQQHVVRAINFVLEDTVEHRVRQVLEEKLAVIAEEFGVDKASDVMDSVEAEPIFDELFVHGLQDPASIEKECDAAINQVRDKVAEARKNSDLLADTHALEPDDARKWRDHPAQFWLERAITTGLPARGGAAVKSGEAWRVRWADGSESPRVCFDARTAEQNPELEWVTLEDPRARAVISELPRWVAGQPLPCVKVGGLPDGIVGVWSLWEISLSAPGFSRKRFLPVFATDDGRTFVPTAKRVWDLLLTEAVEIHGTSTAPTESATWFDDLDGGGQDPRRAPVHRVCWRNIAPG